jgi:hypothetical protein
MMSLEARCLLAQLTSGDERRAHATVAAELAADFARSLSPEMRAAFHARPLLEGIVPTP